MLLASVLTLCVALTCTVASETCLNKTEYDFYILGNLVIDFEKRIQWLKENIQEEVQTKCPKVSCPVRACADDWVSYNGSCYFFENARKFGFEGARAFCKQKESVILYVADESENAFIVRMIKRFKSSTHWFNGLVDQNSKGQWKWTDITLPTTHSQWSPGQPRNQNGENCVIYHINDSYQWHDASCTDSFHAICKKEI